MITQMLIVNEKDETDRIIERLPKNTIEVGYTYENYTREVIEHGLVDSKTGKTKTVEEIRKKYALLG
jgi:hypothetical protein